MSGHSKWATIKRQKGVNDAKRGALFTKLGNQIAVAARGGVDPTTNSNLAMVIDKAKKSGMPLSNIERAIARISDKSVAAVEEVTYEAYGPGGTGLIIETATDNRNRTFPEVRSVLTKTGGTVAEPGSVMFQFSRKGVVRVAASGEEALLSVLDAGAEDAVEEDGEIVVYTGAKELMKVRDALVGAGLEVKEAELAYVPNATVEIGDAEVARKVVKLLDALDDLDDVTNVHSNFEIADGIDI
jgi:YebC/PmpR family DNA-binding regulatory protein